MSTHPLNRGCHHFLYDYDLKRIYNVSYLTPAAAAIHNDVLSSLNVNWKYLPAADLPYPDNILNKNT